jgi:hypothetical protein
MKNYFITLCVISFLFMIGNLSAQEDEEPILYYQMEPLDDSLFIQIQNEVFIDPPDPKAEIIVDLRDPNNQTVAIKGALYPFLAFTPETRARITTYPFKLNLGETIHYASVFTRVIEKMRISKIFDPPTTFQISPTLGYISPFLQLYGGERFGFPIKDDIGLSFGLGTPYSGALETDFVELNFHILGFRMGVFNYMEGFTTLKNSEKHNNLYNSFGFQLGYVVPIGNFLELGYTEANNLTSSQYARFNRANDSTSSYFVKIVDGSYFNWEFRYPIRVLGSTRSKFYVARYLNEWHVGYWGREMALAGSVFDFRFDGMVKSDIRQPQYVFEIMVQRIFGSWAFSALSVGPSIILSRTASGNFGMISIFANIRAKIGTSF